MSRPETIAFGVKGEPIAKARPRVTRNGTFTPKATVAAEARIATACRSFFPRLQPDDTEAWRLSITFCRYERLPRDLDNLVKLVQDALQGVIWADDSQVEAYGDMETIWVDRRDQAGIDVVATPIRTTPRPPRSTA